MKATKKALAKTNKQKLTNRPRYRFTFGRGAQKGPAAPARVAAPVATPKSAPLATKQPVLTAVGPAGSRPATLQEPLKTRSGVDLTEKIQEMVNLAHERGFLTADDINDALGDATVTAEDVDEVYTRLGNLDIEIVDHSEGEAPARTEEEPEESRVENVDDPVRMYMRQMAKVPLLTREQEVAICKRIEEAEVGLKKILYRFGFTARSCRAHSRISLISRKSSKR
jgi:RNA polymerase primary sigma factor